MRTPPSGQLSTLFRAGMAVSACVLISACATEPATNKVTTNKITTAARQSQPQPIASAEDYVRVCGICHLENGNGVPGAFPPLDTRLKSVASSAEGRNYLIGLLKNGLYGEINVNGTKYNGAMPALASQLSEQQMAELLNYVLLNFAQAATDPQSATGETALFSAEEILTRMVAVETTTGADLRLQVKTLTP